MQYCYCLPLGYLQVLWGTIVSFIMFLLNWYNIILEILKQIFADQISYSSELQWFNGCFVQTCKNSTHPAWEMEEVYPSCSSERGCMVETSLSSPCSAPIYLVLGWPPITTTQACHCAQIRLEANFIIVGELKMLCSCIVFLKVKEWYSTRFYRCYDTTAVVTKAKTRTGVLVIFVSHNWIFRWNCFFLSIIVHIHLNMLNVL